MVASLQTRLLLAVGALALAAVAAVAFSARQGTRLEFRKFQELEQIQTSERAAGSPAAVAPAIDGRCCSTDDMRRVSDRLAGRDTVVVVDAAGGFVAAGGPGAEGLREIRTWVAEGLLHLQGERLRGGMADSMTLRFGGAAPARITTTDGRAADVYVIPMPRREAEQPAAAFLGSVDRRLLAVTMFVGALTIGVTFMITRRIVRPIGELSLAVRDLAEGHLSRRVDTRGSDEIAALGQSFNAMASELERQQTMRRRLAHDVSHELRTPLTALQCRLETMIDGLATDPGRALADANEEVRHLSRLVDDLQEIALAEAGELALSMSDVSIAQVAASAARAAGLEADGRLSIEADERLAARADSMRVRQVLLNLLTNASRHTPAGGVIAIRASRAGADVVVEVANTGSTLAAEESIRIFDRFYRADPARQRVTGGTGLGLAIVKHLVEAQGGQVGAESSASGVVFRFTLPWARG